MKTENELIGVLDNGISYYLYNKKEENIKIVLTINAGATSEDKDQNGIAHLLEHMCMSYVKFKENNIFMNKFNRIEANRYIFSGYTDFDRIILRIISKEYSTISMENGVLLLEKIINGEMLKEELLKDIKKEVIDEIISFKKRNYIQSKIISFITEGRRKTLPMGNIKHIDNLEMKEILKFLKKIFTPSNIAIIIVGDIDIIKTENIIRKTFNSRNAKKNIEIKREMNINYSRNEILTINDKFINYTTVKVYYKFICKQTDINERLIKYFFEKMLQNRMKDKFKSYGFNLEEVTSEDKRNIDGLDYFVFIYKTNHLRDTIALYLNIIEDIKLNGFIKKEYEKEIIELEEIMDTICLEEIDIDNVERCKAYIGNFIYNDIIFFVQEDYDLIINSIQNITIDKINQYMLSILKNNCRIVVLKGSKCNNINF